MSVTRSAAAAAMARASPWRLLGGAMLWACVLAAAPAGAGAGDDIFARPVLSPDTLVALTLERNLDLRAATEAANEAAARIGVAASLDDPVVSYTLAPATISSRLGTRQGFGIEQGLPWPGTLGARKAKARAEATAASEDAANLKLELVAAVKAAFAEWSLVHAALDLNSRHRAQLAALSSASKRGYAAGAVRQDEAVGAEIELARSESEQAQFESEQRSIQARINALLNREPSAPLPPPAPLTDAQATPAPDLLTQQMLAQHPQLRQAEAMREASRKEISLARKGFFPNLSVRAGYDEMWDEREMRPNVGISLSVPLQWGRHQAELEAAQAKERGAALGVESRVAQLKARLAQAHAAAQQSARTVALYRDRILPLARAAAASALASYRSGGSSFKAVIDTERARLNEELNLERARADQFRALAELEKAAGGHLPSATNERSEK